MSSHEADGMVQLGARATEPQRTEGASGATRLAASGGGLTGLGAGGAKSGLAGLGTGGGLTGLGASRAAGGLTGLGTGGAKGSLTGLGTGGAQGGLTGLGARQPAAPEAAPKPASGIRIDPSAADRIRKLLEERGTPDAALRIRVRGGGCSGLQYDMEFADEPRERDRVFAEHGVKIYVDPKSYIFLIGTTLRYQQGLLESGFKLDNPNVKKSCGCGESFTI